VAALQLREDENASGEANVEIMAQACLHKELKGASLIEPFEDRSRERVPGSFTRQSRVAARSGASGSNESGKAARVKEAFWVSRGGSHFTSDGKLRMAVKNAEF